MNNIHNRKVMCDVLLEKAKDDKDIIVLCSDSRGSGSMLPFASTYPSQFVEVGIAEQDLVGIASGLALCGKKSFAISPACFLSTRSYEQVKIDCAYANSNVKLIGISGGISYGALGMSHHSVSDIASMCAIPNMRVYLPSDRFLTRKLFEHLVDDNKTAYVRIGRNPVEDVYENDNIDFTLNKAIKVIDGNDILIVACGEMVVQAKEAIKLLNKNNISATLLDMYCLKPLDSKSIIEEAKGKKFVVTVEEHNIYGGLGSLVCQVLANNFPLKVYNLALPDDSTICGKSLEVFHHYGIDAIGIYNFILKELANE